MTKLSRETFDTLTQKEKDTIARHNLRHGLQVITEEDVARVRRAEAKRQRKQARRS